jgi:hypothetical protein
MAKTKASTKTQVNLTTTELRGFISHIIANNRYLQSTGKLPVAINVEGEAGIGKTSTILQLAKDLNLHYRKISLSQIEEIGDLVGFPHKEFEVVKEKDGHKDIRWVPESLLNTYISNEFRPTGGKRMTHAAPEWIQGLEEGGLLILDDYTRADSRFMQSAMEIIDRQEYISWKLPKDWHVILTTNPDSGDYLVSSLDPAQKTRFVTINLKFDKDCWAEWAEANGIDSRCINFLLMHKELVTQTTNARSITTFFNCISSIPVFEDQLPMIQMIGEGSVGLEFSSMFTMFINNKLDKMIDPETILTHDNESYILGELRNAIGRDDAYRADIASVMMTRIINYALVHAETKPVDPKMIKRVIRLAVDEETFTNDLKYILVKKLIAGNKQKFQGIMSEPKLIEMAMK